MNKNFLISAFGPDKTGLVEEFTDIVVKQGFNITTSRMAILGDHFSVLMLVSGDIGKVDNLSAGLKNLRGLESTLREVNARPAPAGVLSYALKIFGADAKGIVHEVAGYLKKNGVNVASLETELSHAPHSGTEVVAMKLVVEIPKAVHLKDFKEGLVEVCDRLNLDLDLEPAA